MKILSGLVLTVFLGLLIAIPITAHSESLPQGCYALQSPQTGSYVVRYYRGGWFNQNDGLSYAFVEDNIDNAEYFYVKPTGPDHYLLHDTAGRYLAAFQPLQVTSGTYPGRYAEWKITSQANGWTLYNVGIGLNLRHATWDGGLYFAPWLPGEERLQLVSVLHCLPYPEASLNVNALRAIPSGNPQTPIRGFSDIHTHLTADQMLGGKFLHGKPFHPYGLPLALDDGAGSHGNNGALDLIGNLFAFEDLNARHDTQGYPTFLDWPSQPSVSHQQAYYRWVERTHKAGLRLMVNYLVENEVLCTVQRLLNPLSIINPANCNTMASIDAQYQTLQDLESYIDAQAGGLGNGFLRLVTTPAEARQVIANHQLPVIVGIEVSELFNCGLSDPVCTPQYIDAQLDVVKNKGVVALFPLHRFDNQFGGSELADGFINIGQGLSTGYFFQTEACPPHIQGTTMTSGFPILGDIPVLSQILDGLGLQPEYDETVRHCNQNGLTPLGEHLIHAMIDRKMLISIDHMSYKSASRVLDIAEARQYSGVISDHDHLPVYPGENYSDLHERIARLGGVISIRFDRTDRLLSKVASMRQIVESSGFLPAVGATTDINGLTTQASQRPNSDTQPLIYPFLSDDGHYVFDRQQTGQRVFDLNQDGVAHYGLVADHVQDIIENGDLATYETLMQSAEAYLQMWERAHGHLQE